MDNKKRINAMLTYFCEEVLDDKYNDKVNVDFLSNDPKNFSIDRIPIEPVVEIWIIPITKKREVYNFRSRECYGPDLADNLSNIGFFEDLEDKIKSNNLKRILPNITGIESIECLNAGSLQVNESNTAVFSVQIEIIYKEANNETNKIQKAL